MSPTLSPNTTIEHAGINDADVNDVFNLTIEEVRMIVRYRTLSPHQQRGVLQAIDVIRPAKPKKPWAARPMLRPAEFSAAKPAHGKFWR